MIRTLLLAAAALCLARPAQAQQPPIPVLTYHRFDPTASHSGTVVTTPKFIHQMEWLAAHHIAVVPLHQAVAALHGGPPVGQAVVLTADDGWKSVYTDMFPVIRRLHLPVTLFLNPPMIGHGGAYLTWPMIDEMQRSGLIDIQAHTMHHPNFNTERTRLGPQAYASFVTHELADCRPALAAHVATPIDAIAWPYGIHDPTLESAAHAAGYTEAFALGSRPMTQDDTDFALPRLQVYDTDTDATFARIATGHPRAQTPRKPTS
jgi:peptidoglycan/xylan/chitin deacetylase (PgdA/CDA1 family)